uniref:Letm1 RBD domain-containing protein n=1 Tax=Eutreptiella gymnastica TaxID=73025 RepID=A0A7S1NU99_9EUGL
MNAQEFPQLSMRCMAHHIKNRSTGRGFVPVHSMCSAILVGMCVFVGLHTLQSTSINKSNAVNQVSASAISQSSTRMGFTNARQGTSQDPGIDMWSYNGGAASAVLTMPIGNVDQATLRNEMSRILPKVEQVSSVTTTIQYVVAAVLATVGAVYAVQKAQKSTTAPPGADEAMVISIIPHTAFAFSADGTRETANQSQPTAGSDSTATSTSPGPDGPDDDDDPESDSDTKRRNGSKVRDSADRLQRLKELAWVKEVKDDLTYAEFALTINPSIRRNHPPGYKIRRKVTGIDYFKIADKLDSSLARMERKKTWLIDVTEINALKARLRNTKKNVDELIVKMHELEQQADSEEDESGKKDGKEGTPSAAGKAEVDGTDKSKESDKDQTDADKKDKKDKDKPLRLELFVRDDGTVDWDGAMESGKELAVFGQEVWDRLNGRTEDGYRSLPENLFASDTDPLILKTKAELEALEQELETTTQARNAKQAVLWEARTTGEPVSNEARVELKALAQSVLELRRRVALQRLDLDMERICLYLEQEIEQSTSLRDQKMLVAEFGLLEKQLQSILAILRKFGDNEFIMDDIEESELELLAKEVAELKVRLGFEISGQSSIDWGKDMRTWWDENVSKFREGLAFYAKGTKMLFSDIVYALWLFKRTTEGYTLKAREVRTVRRTMKDFLTFIPTVIILLIPLSPIGHVLVFSFIQRFFPEFFPSSFSDRRQNLLKMYEEIEKKDPNQEAIGSQ